MRLLILAHCSSASCTSFRVDFCEGCSLCGTGVGIEILWVVISEFMRFRLTFLVHPIEKGSANWQQSLVILIVLTPSTSHYLRRILHHDSKCCSQNYPRFWRAAKLEEWQSLVFQADRNTKEGIRSVFCPPLLFAPDDPTQGGRKKLVVVISPSRYQITENCRLCRITGNTSLFIVIFNLPHVQYLIWTLLCG